MEKLIALFHVYGHQVRRFCQAPGHRVRFCQALGQHPHLNSTCVHGGFLRFTFGATYASVEYKPDMKYQLLFFNMIRLGIQTCCESVACIVVQKCFYLMPSSNTNQRKSKLSTGRIRIIQTRLIRISALFKLFPKNLTLFYLCNVNFDG